MAGVEFRAHGPLQYWDERHGHHYVVLIYFCNMAKNNFFLMLISNTCLVQISVTQSVSFIHLLTDFLVLVV